MLVAAHQLHYLPWLRYYHKIAAADLFVLLDDIQFEKNGWQNRNKIKGPQGPICLTVPVQNAFGEPINAVRIAANQPRWAEKHLRAFTMNYAKAPFFEEHRAFLEELYARSWEHLAPLSWEILRYTLETLGIRTPIVRSSELNVPGGATERLIGLCEAVGGDTYLTGAYALDAYLDADALAAAGLKLAIQEWQCPKYRQLYPSQGFVPDLCIFDLLFNEGINALEVLMAGGQVAG